MAMLVRNAYQHVHRQIANGSLAPGDVISESTLAKELDCSRTPIGEALQRLAEEGLVKQIPRYGTIVRDLTAGELIEDFEVREAIETYAVRKLAKVITAKTIEDLKSLCQTIDDIVANLRADGKDKLEGETLRKFLNADMTFHLLIISAAGNTKLLQISQRAGSVYHIFQTRRGNHSIQRVENANSMHKRILEALSQNDEAQAASLITEHIRSSAAISLEEKNATDNKRVSLSSLELPFFLKD